MVACVAATTNAPIMGFLREADAGLPVKDLCRRHGFSEVSYTAAVGAAGAGGNRP